LELVKGLPIACHPAFLDLQSGVIAPTAPLSFLSLLLTRLACMLMSHAAPQSD
jgi:hypothetical protein